jgi:hypothetical protein
MAIRKRNDDGFVIVTVRGGSVESSKAGGRWGTRVSDGGKELVQSVNFHVVRKHGSLVRLAARAQNDLVTVSVLANEVAKAHAGAVGTLHLSRKVKMSRVRVLGGPLVLHVAFVAQNDTVTHHALTDKLARVVAVGLRTTQLVGRLPVLGNLDNAGDPSSDDAVVGRCHLFFFS